LFFEQLKVRPYWGNHFWAPGYCVDTIGLDEEKIQARVRELGRQISKDYAGRPLTLVGILTRRDLKFLESSDWRIAEVMTRSNLVKAPPHTTLDDAEAILNRAKKQFPIVAQFLGG